MPDTTLEDRIRAAFAEALGTLPGDDEDIFDAGADSLAVENVLSGLSADLSMDLPGWILLDNPTVRSLAAALATYPTEQ